MSVSGNLKKIKIKISLFFFVLHFLLNKSLVQKLLDYEKVDETRNCRFDQDDTLVTNYTEILQLAQIWRDDLNNILETQKILPKLRILRLEDILDDNFLKKFESFIQMPLKGYYFKLFIKILPLLLLG